MKNLRDYLPIFNIIVTALFLLIPYSATAIVNMDGLHFKNSQKDFSAVMDFKVDGASGNSDNSNIALDTQLSWIEDNYINLAIFGYKYGKNNNTVSANKSFVHFRHIHKIITSYDWEVFTQIEQNKFTRLSHRGLIGAGLRHNTFNSDNHQAFFGAGAYYTKEDIEQTTGLTDDGTETYFRANLYFLSKYKISPNISFTNAAYYQPRLNRFSGYRALVQSKFDFKMNDNLKLRLSIDIEHDNEPPQSIEKTDVSYLTGLVFSF